MSGKKTDAASVVWTAVRTGGAAVGITLLLLLPVAIMIQRGTIHFGDRMLCQGIALFLAGILSAVLCRCGRAGGAVAVLLAVILSGIVFLILSAGIPGGAIKMESILPVTAAVGAGIAVGSIIQNNKKLKKRKRK